MVEISLEQMLKLMDKQFAGVPDPSGALQPFIDGALYVDASFVNAPTNPTLAPLCGQSDSCKDPLSLPDALDLFKRVKRTVLDDESVYSSPMQLAEISELVFLDDVSVDHEGRVSLGALRAMRDDVHTAIKRKLPSPTARTAKFAQLLESVNAKLFAGDDRRPSKADIELVAYAFTHFYEKGVPVGLVTFDMCQGVLAQDCARLLFSPESPLHIDVLVKGRDPNNFVVFTGRYAESAKDQRDFLAFRAAQVEGKPLRKEEMYTWRFDAEVRELRAALEGYRARKTRSFIEFSTSKAPAPGVNFKNYITGIEGVKVAFDNGSKTLKVSSTERSVDALKALVSERALEFNAKEQRKVELDLVKCYTEDEEEQQMPPDRKLELLERRVAYFRGQAEAYRVRLDRAIEEKTAADGAKAQLERDLDDFLGDKKVVGSADSVFHDECAARISSLEDELARRPVYVPAGLSSSAKEAFSYIRMMDEELAVEVAPGKRLSDFRKIEADDSEVYASAKAVLALPEGMRFINREDAQKFVDEYDASVRFKARCDEVVRERERSEGMLAASTLEVFVNLVDGIVIAPVDVSAKAEPLEAECLSVMGAVLGERLRPMDALGTKYAAFAVPRDVLTFKGWMESELSSKGIPLKVKVRVLDLKEY